MILLTVGTQLPFDRLVKAVDAIAASVTEPIFAQIGEGAYIPRNMSWRDRVNPTEFSRMAADASAIVSHAGIGTVLMASKYRKAVVLYPRRAEFGEHRNDHQLATIGALRGRPGVYIAFDDEELGRLLRMKLDPPVVERPSESSDRLRRRVVEFIRGTRANVDLGSELGTQDDR